MPQIPIAPPGPLLKRLAEAGLPLWGLMECRALDDRSRIEAPTAVHAKVAPGALVEIGAFCNLSGGEINNVRFGRYGSMAAGAVIGAHEHPTDWLTTSRTAYYPQVNGWDALMAGADAPGIHARVRPFARSCPVTEIGPDVWIGQGAFVRAGVAIGAGAVVGARATVLKDVPPYAVVVGTPARVVRLRFPEPVVERLLALAWWRFSIYDLFDAPFDRIEEALDVLEAAVAAGTVRPWEGPALTAADLARPQALEAAVAGRFSAPPCRAAS